MSMGLGKKYWVHLIDFCFGTLDECIKFMQENKPLDDKHWFELHPQIKVKKGDCKIKEYRVDLVEEAK